MQHYSVTGMSCAACSTRVEKAVGKVPGVVSVSVSLLTNSMVVEGNVAPNAVLAAVSEAGYGATYKTTGDKAEKNNDNIIEDMEEQLKDKETPKLKVRFILSLIILLPLMYVSMGHMMWNWPLPDKVADNHVAMGLYQLLLTAAIMIINQRFFVSGFTSLIHRNPNMDTLVALGSTASFGYSVYALFAMTDAVIHGTDADVMKYMNEFYFESAAMILTLITLGKLLEAYSKGKTTDALKGLMRLAPKTATKVVDGEERQVPIEQVSIGDIFVVKPGESVPVDGVVVEGVSAIDESALTGESIPVDKTVGDSVSAATINQSGFIRCEATRVGSDTTLSQVIQMVSEAASTKAPIAKVADKVSGVFVPTVIVIAIITLLVWLLTGQGTGFALARAISVLVISCPCALGLATPVAIMVGNGMGARKGILFKNAVALEQAAKINVVALDKTGTITVGKPQVTDVIVGEGVSENDLINYAYSLEKLSEHPLAGAVVEYYQGKISNPEKCTYKVENFMALPGNGLCGLIGDRKIYGGNEKFIREHISISGDIKGKAEELANQGKTPLYFAMEDKDNSKLLGIIAVADVIRDDSIEAVEQLKAMGIHVVMLTGDNEKTANAIGSLVGVDEVIAGVLPEGKEAVIRKLKGTHNRVAMVGDGINDAPALTRADIGIAIGAGTDIAIDAADVVLMKDTVLDVAAAIRLSRSTLRNIHQNLFWAFIYNVIGIPLAAGVWYPLLGWKLNPMFGAAAMSLSSFCVVTNALRLNLKNIGNSARDKMLPKNKRYENKDNKGDSVMEKTVVIEGMMCGHCEARVKKTLENLPQVDEAVVSHEKGTAVIKLNADIDEATVKAAIEEQDYTFVEMR
ncbi:MAG: heavy metal translocating P-type ATPase [Wujia sp.]